MIFKSITTLVLLTCCLASLTAVDAAKKQLRVALRNSLACKSNSLGQFKRELKAIRTQRAEHSTKATASRSVKGYDSKLDSAYFTDITLGTPPQNFTVKFSSDGSNLFVTSAGCMTNQCEKLNRYQSGKSSTYKEDGRGFSWSSAILDLAGRISLDDLHIGSRTVKQMPFGEMTYVKYFDGSAQADAVFGLLFDQHSVPELNSPIDNFYTQGLIDKRVFSIYWNETKSHGELIFGEPDTDKGEVNFVPVISSVWEIYTDSISVNGTEIISGPIDTGLALESSFHHADHASARKINFKLGAVKAPHIAREVYEFDCTKLDQIPRLSFRIGGVEYAQNLSNIVTRLRDSDGKEYCISNMIGDNGFPFILFGAPLIGPHYTVFDMDQRQVGFA